MYVYIYIYIYTYNTCILNVMVKQYGYSHIARYVPCAADKVYCIYKILL